VGGCVEYAQREVRGRIGGGLIFIGTCTSLQVQVFRVTRASGRFGSGRVENE